MANSTKPQNIEPPAKHKIIIYNGLLQLFIVRAPLLWSNLESIAEEVHIFLAGESNDENPNCQAKLDNCMGWVETQLAEYRVTFNDICDTVIKLYLSNGAKADGYSVGSASDVPPSLSFSCTTSQREYRKRSDLMPSPLTKGMTPLEVTGWIEKLEQ